MVFQIEHPFGVPSQPAPSGPRQSSPLPPAGLAVSSSMVNPFGTSSVANGSPKVGGASGGLNTTANISKIAPGTSKGFGVSVQQNGNTQNGPFKRGGGKTSIEEQFNGSTVFQGGRNRKDGRRERKAPHIPSQWVGKSAPTRQPTERTKELSPFAYNYATTLYDRLNKDHIKAPNWPSDLGNPDKRGVVEGLKETYKKYRTRVYDSLRKAEIIDDPEKRRRLVDALPFKGICEDMCPEFERISRIAEHDVKMEEKEAAPDGYTMWANPAKMVKKFGRSAAGQDAPLPQDVRSVDALRRTTDYLFNDLLQSDNNLPSMHNFLWDRTRAVRRDFTFHSQKSAEEMKDLVYCFETITRFHATALHLLSRKGFSQEDFDFKQEIEQLGRTILSLMEAYDTCREMKVRCENEAEFRAYYLLLNVHDPSIAKRIPAWGKEYWFESEEIQIALSLVQAMEDVREAKGPIRPKRWTTLSDAAFTTYFSIVEDPKVSYTMACIAEIHFTTVRQNILRNLVRGYSRYRDAPRTISAPDLNKLLRFDTPEEAVEFAESHNFEFSSEYPQGKAAPPAPYLVLNDKKKSVPSPRITQSFSGQLVERKRGSQLLPYIIYNTIYEQVGEKPNENRSQDEAPDSLFMPQSVQPDEATSGVNNEELVASDDALSPPISQRPPPSAQPPLGILDSSKQVQTPDPFSLPATYSPAPTQPTPLAAFTPSNAAATGPGTTTGFPATPEPTFFLGSGISPATKPGETPSPFSTFGKDVSTPKNMPSQPIQSQAPSPPTAAPLSETPPMSKSSSMSIGNSFPGLGALGSAPAHPSPLSKVVSPSPEASQLGAPVSAPSVPSIMVTKPAFPAGPRLVGLDQKRGPSLPSTAPAGAVPAVNPPFSTQATPAAQFGSALKPLPQSRPVVAPPVLSSSLLPPGPPQDPMDSFTKWYVLGDDGLLEQFTEFMVQEIVTRAFRQFEEEEENKRRRAEDQKSWREARKFRIRSLGTRYLYKWQENARARATQRILAEGKEKMRLYREQERIAKEKAREEAIKAERQARKNARRQIEADGQELSLLASTARLRRSGAEEQLLASGVFSGLRDERAAARRATQDTESDSYAESDLVLEPRRQSVSTQRYAQTPESSIGKREGWKTRSLREKFGLEHRRSVSAGSSVNGSSSLRQSLPAPKRTNFSRKQASDKSSDDERGPRRKLNNKTNGFRTSHWDLRARGFIPTPDGLWAAEQPASTTQIIKCFNTSGINGLISEKRTHDTSLDGATVNDGSPTSLQQRLEGLRRPTMRIDPGQMYRSRSRSVSYILSPPPLPEQQEASPNKRKRQTEEEDWEEGSSLSVTKRSHISREESKAMVANVQKMVRELKQAMDKLDEDKVMFREQSGVLRDHSLGF